MLTVVVKLLGGYMFKSMLIKWVLPSVVDLLIEALVSLSKKSSNTVDDAMAAMFVANKETIIIELKRNL
ncbi:MAG: hypothetical protein COA94_04740 [Rickettsiales bacterium]|nr:MAG: hypothetical protein COA94_04740 [Rickettsiales bacterium]